MKTVNAYQVNIHIAGDLQAIRATCRKFCYEKGLCVSVTPTEYIYTGGAETGAIVGLINYPRFPELPEVIHECAGQLADQLMVDCCQRSCTVVAPDETHYLQNLKLKPE